jgi:hypothetical protein
MQHRHWAVWRGDPERLPDAFRVSKVKGDRIPSAVCETWTHPARKEDLADS